jgi:DNA-binding SARP family transcriptional activator
VDVVVGGDILSVHLLGRVAVMWGDSVARALTVGPLLRFLASMLLRPGVPIARTAVAFTLWPDSSEAQARTNLRKAIHQLRQDLPDHERFVEIDGSSLRWRPDAPAEVDVVRFLAACNSGDDRAAVAAYGGSLLPELYDDCVLAERARLHGLATSALARLVEQAAAAGDESARLDLGLRLVELEPTSEWAHREVISAHLARADRAAAIRAYHRCVDVLEVDLGVGPAPETRALYDRLTPQRGELAGVAPRRAPLVGRHAEWSVLDRPGLESAANRCGWCSSRASQGWARADSWPSSPATSAPEGRWHSARGPTTASTRRGRRSPHGCATRRC